MESKNDGGPAFPGFEHFIAGDKVLTGKPHGGMTLRDYFAAAALTGYRMFAGRWYEKHEFGFASPEQIAEWAYADADAMLAARSA